MLRNFLKIAWRNIIRHKKHAAINIAGLALGITCCLFIFLWVEDEKGMDNFHANGPNLFTVYQTTEANGQVSAYYNSPLMYDTAHKPTFLMENIKDAVPEIEDVSFYAPGYELPWGHPETFRAGEKLLKMEGSRAGKDFFEMFSYPLITGTPATALKDMKGIAISRKMAEIFFGSPGKAMGQTMRYENKFDVTVTAVFENVTAKSSLKFDFLLNWDAQKNILEWASNGFQTYVQLAPGANVALAEANINRFLKAQLPKTNGITVNYGLQPYSDQYLHSVFVNGKPAAGRIEYVRIFSGVALFILIIACINFMNLSTARSVKRAKEVGLRKVVGSGRLSLIIQFIGESLLFTLAAMLVSILLMYLLLPAFNSFTNKQIAAPVIQPAFWMYFLALLFITGIVAGSYPALYLSALKPVRVLKGVVSFSRGATWFRKGLTVFQFVLSIFLIIATIVIIRQTNFVENTQLGYNRDNLVYIQVEGELSNGNKYQLFKNQLQQMPGIAMVDRSTEAPHSMGFTVYDDVRWDGKDKNASVGFKPSSVGFDFIKLMNLRMADGRDFSRLNATDSSDAYIINEEAAKEMGIKNPVGKWISAWDKKGHIIGIVKDYHINSLREPIHPLILDVKEDIYFGVVIVRTKPGQTKQALASMAKVYKTLNPNYPFTWQFVDEEYKKLYNNEQMVAKLTVVFAVLAILISCLGLLGLVMFAAEQRLKEIGVRKVLGASLSQVAGLFSKDFLQLICLAFLVASPLAWFAMHNWLQGFAYRVAISWWVFGLALSISILIALLTISYQSVKAAMANPVKSLRTE